MSEPEFLTGKALADCVRLVCRERDVDCAVAFLGRGMQADLFPTWSRQNVRIVCDLSMGCNARAALEEFGAPENDRLRCHGGLHAKVYLSDAGAVIASANLSRNGLGRAPEKPGNLEAGVHHAAGSLAWTAAKEWFEKLFLSSAKIDAAQLARAPQSARDPAQRVSELGVYSPSVLDRVWSDPDRFEGVMLLCTEDEIPDKYQKRVGRALEATDRDESGTSPDHELFWLDDQNRIPAGSAAILYWRGKGSQLRAYVDVVRVRTDDGVALYGINDWPGFWRNQGLPAPGRREAVALDRERILKLNDGEWAFVAHVLANRLSDLADG